MARRIVTLMLFVFLVQIGTGCCWRHRANRVHRLPHKHLLHDNCGCDPCSTSFTPGTVEMLHPPLKATEVPSKMPTL